MCLNALVRMSLRILLKEAFWLLASTDVKSLNYYQAVILLVFK